MVYDSKKWTVINATLVPHLPFTWEGDDIPIHNAGGSVDFDFERIDLVEYPYMRTVPYAQSVVEEGDCIYIPGSYVYTGPGRFLLSLSYLVRGLGIRITCTLLGTTGLAHRQHGLEIFRYRFSFGRVQHSPLAPAEIQAQSISPQLVVRTSRLTPK